MLRIAAAVLISACVLGAGGYALLSGISNAGQAAFCKTVFAENESAYTAVVSFLSSKREHPLLLSVGHGEVYDGISETVLPMEESVASAFAQVARSFAEHDVELDGIRVENDLVFFKSIDGRMNFIYVMDRSLSGRQQRKAVQTAFYQKGLRLKALSAQWYCQYR